MGQSDGGQPLSMLKKDLLQKILQGKHASFEEEILHPAPRTDHVPASFAQRRLWFLDQLHPQNAFYNVPFALRLTGKLQIMALKQSIQELINRHESLRTIFSYEQEELVQVIKGDLHLDVPCIDLTHLAGSEQEEEAMRQIVGAAQIPFSLNTGPLLRAQIYRFTSINHILFVNFHHIITDGWSEQIFFKELHVIYDRLMAHTEIKLPALPFQYADYSLWQHGWLKEEVLERQLAYWKQQLGELPLLTLPYDRPRPMQQTFRGALFHLHFPAFLQDQLKQLSRQEGASFFMTMLTALKILIYRYTQQEDIVVATPIANRNRKEWEDIIGFFANTIVLRTDLSGSPSFREVLRRVCKVAVEAYSHQDVPFEQITATLAPDRDLSTNPLFQILCSLVEAPEESPFSNLTTEFIEIDNRTAKFDLDLQLVNRPDGLSGSLEWNTDLFDEATIQRMVGHYQVTLASMVEDPDQSIADFNFLTEDELQLLLTEWNATATEYPEELCLHHLFEKQVRRSPNEPAVLFGHQVLTYRELNQRANGVARFLRLHGVGPETPVGICMGRSFEIVVAILGILKAGGGYVPLDPGYPQERLQFMVKDAQISLLITTYSPSEPIWDSSIQCVYLDQMWDNLELADDTIDACTPDNLALLIYTSGSTGKPKGVELHHRPLVNLMSWQTKSFVFQPKARSLQFSSFSFDLSCLELFSTFATGSPLILPEDQQRNDPEQLLQLLIDQHVERAFFPYVALQQLAEVVAQRNTSSLGLKEMVVVGEQLRMTPSIVALLTRLEGCVLHNEYGPSETHVVTSYPVYVQQEKLSLPPIGRPIANTQLYILDPHMYPVPIGIQGELYIAGLCLARGYLNRPDLTEERFIRNPFSPDPSAKMYKTGDIVRYLPDGSVQFLGRVDAQIKIRGFRVELGEVEVTLQQYPGITGVVVIARTDSSGLNTLRAYYVACMDISGQELRSFLLTRLPDFMVPIHYMQLEALPLTPSGKVNRQVLPEPDGLSSSVSLWEEPETPTELQVAQIWSDLLGISSISRNDHFFRSGGHSLIATRVLSRVRRTMQVEVPLRLLFEAPILKDFAQQLDEAQSQAGKYISRRIQSLRREDHLPLSFGQERLWFFDQLEPENPAYHLLYAIEISGDLHLALLEKCLNEIIRRHEVLRTTFQIVENHPVQVIAPVLPLSLSVVDLASFPPEARKLQALHLAQHEVEQPFDLRQGPLLRATAYFIAERVFILTVVMHHIITDGWSMQIFARELSRLYRSYEDNTPPNLAPLPVQYADFAYWQREWIRGEGLHEQHSYWKQKLSGTLPILDLPLDRPRPPVQSFQGSQVTFILNRELTDTIYQLSQQEDVSIYMTLLSVFAALLYRLSGQGDLVIGTPIANRNHQEIEGLIGFFVNTLVLRLQLSTSMTWKALLRQVKQVTLEAYTNQDMPFTRLVEEIQPERDLSAPPLFQVMFALQNVPPDAGSWPEQLSCQPLDLPTKSCLFDLNMSLEEVDHTLRGVVEYSSALFNHETIDRFIHCYEQLLRGFLGDPDQLVDLTQMLRTTELQKIVVTWNQTTEAYPREKLLHHLIEEMADLYPHKLAVVDHGQQMTYLELDEKANHLAEHLQHKHVRPDTPIGVLMDRSLDLIVALVAILKAGGTYVPLDPKLPSERILYIINNSHIPLLLTRPPYLSLFTHGQTDSLILNLEEQLFEQEWSPKRRIMDENSFHSEQLAYIIYTSGSTGKPKGVMISHRSAVNFCLSLSKHFEFTPEDRVAQFANISFDMSICDIFLTLVRGATLVLTPETMLAAEDFTDWLLRERITFVDLPTAYWDFWTHQLTTCDKALPPSLRMIMTGGEKVSLSTYRAWLKLGQGRVPAWVAYGPAETTVVATAINPMTLLEQHPLISDLPIGYPIANTEVYVLNTRMQPVPIGVVGELYISGIGLARGYCNRADLTAERFLPHPFKQGERIYKTGDRVRYLPDGNLEYVDRVDNQVKIRGFRVEPGEIEVTLECHPTIQKAVVVVQDNLITEEKQLVAYITLKDTMQLFDQHDLQAFARQSLPAYMVPSYYVLLDAFPMTASGKVDRKALPKPQHAPITTAQMAAPRTQTETIVTEIWKTILHRKEINLVENFFSLGGHSLLATQVISQIRTSLGVEVPLKLLFEFPTIAELAVALDSLEKKVTTEPKIVKRSRLPRTLRQ